MLPPLVVLSGGKGKTVGDLISVLAFQLAVGGCLRICRFFCTHTNAKYTSYYMIVLYSCIIILVEYRIG